MENKFVVLALKEDYDRWRSDYASKLTNTGEEAHDVHGGGLKIFDRSAAEETMFNEKGTSIEDNEPSHFITNKPKPAAKRVSQISKSSGEEMDITAEVLKADAPAAIEEYSHRLIRINTNVAV